MTIVATPLPMKFNPVADEISERPALAHEFIDAEQDRHPGHEGSDAGPGIASSLARCQKMSANRAHRAKPPRMSVFDQRINVLPAILAIGVAFVVGIGTQALTPSPYYEAKRWTAQGAALVERLLGKQKNIAASALVPAERSLDTVLLPLIKETATLPAESGVAPIAGGITTYGNDIIIADRLGTFFRVSNHGSKIAKLALPALPNHVAEYLRFAWRINVDGFRVHDVKSRQEPAGLRLFVSFENFLPGRKTTDLALATMLLSDKDLAPIGTWEILYESPPLLVDQKHYAGLGGGGAILVVGDRVYLSVGDYTQDSVTFPSKMTAQDPNSDFGTVQAIDLTTKQKTRISNGHRNPEGLAVNWQGLIYETEQGPNGGDKLNLIEPGKNYGWPVETYGTDYTSYDWPHARMDTRGMKFQKPVFAWVPDIAPSEIIEADNFNPRWDHDLLVASLQAETLFRLHMEEGRVVYVEPIFIGERLRDLAILADGTLVLWTDEAHLIFLNVDTAALLANRRPHETVTDVALAPCMTCHHVGPTTPYNFAPSLSKIFGRKIASDSFDRYSAALKRLNGDWREDNLFAFITDPSGFAPGTKMTYSASAADAYQIIDLLKNLN
jgi:cytochrome c2